MNPAALMASLPLLKPGAEIIVNTDEFTKRNLTKISLTTNPLDDGTLSNFSVHPVGLTSLTVEALSGSGLGKKDAERAKNMFALGLVSWLYHRDLEATETFLNEKFARKPEILKANITALHAGLQLRGHDRGLRGPLRGRSGSDA